MLTNHQEIGNFVTGMNALIQSVIKEWEATKKQYSFETRIHPILNPYSITKDTPFINMVFIIDVGGFFIDKEHTRPIKLHHERVISIDRYNTDKQYIEDFRRALNLFTATAYAQFEKIFTSLPEPIYTSDPLHMK